MVSISAESRPVFVQMLNVRTGHRESKDYRKEAHQRIHGHQLRRMGQEPLSYVFFLLQIFLGGKEGLPKGPS
jgi:hypothetical protein